MKKPRHVPDQSRKFISKRKSFDSDKPRAGRGGEGEKRPDEYSASVSNQSSDGETSRAIVNIKITKSKERRVEKNKKEDRSRRQKYGARNARINLEQEEGRSRSRARVDGARSASKPRAEQAGFVFSPAEMAIGHSRMPSISTRGNQHHPGEFQTQLGPMHDTSRNLGPPRDEYSRNMQNQSYSDRPPSAMQGQDGLSIQLHQQKLQQEYSQ